MQPNRPVYAELCSAHVCFSDGLVALVCLYCVNCSYSSKVSGRLRVRYLQISAIERVADDLA